MKPATDQSIAEMIESKGMTAPRITPADVEASIDSEHYFTAEEGALGAWVASTKGPRENDPPAALKLLTFCVLVLHNGFTVSGESACASPENFDADIGRAVARKAAIAKVWPLLGYALKQRLSFVPECSPAPSIHPFPAFPSTKES